MTWHCISFKSDMGNLVQHIVPVDDLQPHTLTHDCWCQPELDHEDWIATHHSADCREDFENGRRKPS